MGVLTAICVDVKDAPPDVKIRHVPRAILDVAGKVLSTVIDTPEAGYCWLVELAGVKSWVSGDHHLPCIPVEAIEKDAVVGRFTKVNPRTGEERYGPADVRQTQQIAWVKAGALTAVEKVVEVLDG